MSFKSAQALNHRNWNLFLGNIGASGDPYYSKVLLLLNNNQPTIVDSGPNSVPLTISGATLDSSNKIFGLPSYKVFPANEVQANSNSIVGLGSNEITIEFYFYIDPTSGSGYLFFIGTVAAFLQPAGTVYMTISINATNYTLTTLAAVSKGIWHHMAFVRQNSGGSGRMYLYLDGVLQNQSSLITASYSYSTGANPLLLGYPAGSANIFYSQVRYTTTARYTGNFTPPNGPFPNS